MIGIRTVASRVLLVSWLAAMLFLGAYTTGAHSAALPKPGANDERLRRGLSALQGAKPRPLAVHALYAACKCSQVVVARLLERGSDARFDEVVLLVGELPEQEPALARRGFRVLHVAGPDLSARYHIEAVPMLLVTDAATKVRYAGGYRKFKGSPSEDQAILDRVANGSGDGAASLPAFGCAISERLRALVDPLGLRD